MQHAQGCTSSCHRRASLFRPLEPFLVRRRSVGDKVRLDSLEKLEEPIHVHEQILDKRKAGNGSIVTFRPRSLITTLQASVLLPLTRIPSDPQTRGRRKSDR